jgi:hypothetical protein
MRFFKALIMGVIVGFLAFLFDYLNMAAWLRFAIILGVAVILFRK